jgi:hypothetical protein
MSARSRMSAVHERLDDLDAGGVARLLHLFELGRAEDERLLAQHVLACSDGTGCGGT